LDWRMFTEQVDSGCRLAHIGFPSLDDTHSIGGMQLSVLSIPTQKVLLECEANGRDSRPKGVGFLSAKNRV